MGLAAGVNFRSDIGASLKSHRGITRSCKTKPPFLRRVTAFIVKKSDLLATQWNFKLCRDGVCLLNDPDIGTGEEV